MLELTDRAASAIKQVMDANELPDEGGLRIAPRTATAAGEASFGISLAEAPETRDHVVEVEGARVFVDPGASGELDDKVLDAQVHPTGEVTFGLGRRGAE